MEQPLRQIIGVHGARMYYNLTSIHAVLRSAPFGDLLTASFNQFVGSDATDTAAAVPLAQRAADRARQAAEVTRVVAAKTTWQYLSVERRVRAVRATRRRVRRAARIPIALDTDRCQELLERLQSIPRDPLRQWNDAALADAGVDGLLRRAAAAARPGVSGRGSAGPPQHAAQGAARTWSADSRPLSSGNCRELVRVDPALSRALRPGGRRRLSWMRLSTTNDSLSSTTRFERFLEQWGFRCSGELMLTVPSFQEDAAPLIELIRSYLLAGRRVARSRSSSVRSRAARR